MCENGIEMREIEQVLLCEKKLKSGNRQIRKLKRFMLLS